MGFDRARWRLRCRATLPVLTGVRLLREAKNVSPARSRDDLLLEGCDLDCMVKGRDVLYENARRVDSALYAFRTREVRG